MNNKYIKYFGLLIIVAFQACDSPIISVEKKELIQLNSFTDKAIKDYEVTYAYAINNSPITTNFTVKSDFELLIISLGNCSPSAKIEYSHDEVFSRFYGFSTEVKGSYYNAKYFYNSPINESIKKIVFHSDGPVNVNFENDSIKSFHTNFHEFAVLINDRENVGIHGEAWDTGPESRDADMMIYKKRGELYLLILTSLRQGKKVKEGFLSDYFQAK